MFFIYKFGNNTYNTCYPTNLFRNTLIDNIFCFQNFLICYHYISLKLIVSRIIRFIETLICDL